MKRSIRFLSLLAALLFVSVIHVWADAKDFSIVVLPDPQHYASKHYEIGLAQTEWIADNIDKLQIKFVVTVGDNVDAGYSDSQYTNSTSFMNKLNGLVPYGIACGNHDLKDTKKGSYTCRKFVDYYGPKVFEKYPWYGGASQSGFSSYQTFTGGGFKFIALELAVAAPQTEIKWAKQVMANNPHTPVILTTHQMLQPDGKLSKKTAVPGPDRQSPIDVWNQLIEPSSQIFLVLSGHYHGEAHLTKTTHKGQSVQVVLQDYQDEPNGGNGWLRIFTFKPDQNKIDVQTYSPSLKEYKQNPSSEFNLTVDFRRLVKR